MRVSALAFAVLAFAVCQSARSAEPAVTYYVGDVVIGSANGSPSGTAVMFLEKTVDQDSSQITERGIQVNPDGTTYDYPMHLQVKGNSFTLSDEQHTTTGAGAFTGTPWNWTYFKATYNTTVVQRDSKGKPIMDPTTGQPKTMLVQTVDENTIVDPSVVTARKVLSVDGNVFETMDITLKQITKQTFTILTSAILGKAQGAAAPQQ